MKNRVSALSAIAAALAIGLFGTPSAGAADTYYMIVYGAQRPVINQARFTHTWATFVHLRDNGPAESITISWLAADLKVKPWKLEAEPGVALSQADTVKWCECNRMEIRQYGPYAICPELWNLAVNRYNRLASGQVLYRASDLLNGPRNDPEVCNCIYAVLDLEERDPALRLATLGFGDAGSAFVVRRLSPYIIDRKTTYPWVSEQIGAVNYPRPGLFQLLDR